MLTGELCGRCGHPDEDHWGNACHFQQHGTRLTCACTRFVSPTIEAIKDLPWEEQKLLACAHFLGIDPDYITGVENPVAGARNYGFVVSVFLRPSEGSLRDWVVDNLPKSRTTAVTAYLVKRAEMKKP
jgi:hypothetical protein